MVTLGLLRVDGSLKRIGARVLFVPSGLIPSHILKPNWASPKG